MSYIAVNLDISQEQYRRLLNGDSIRVKPGQAGAEGGFPVALTQTQINKAKKSAERGVGFVLRLSKAQVKAMEKSGDGLFDVAKSLLKSVVRDHGGTAVDFLGGLAKNQLGRVVPEELRGIVDAGVDLGASLGRRGLKGVVGDGLVGGGLFLAGRARG